MGVACQNLKDNKLAFDYLLRAYNLINNNNNNNCNNNDNEDQEFLKSII